MSTATPPIPAAGPAQPGLSEPARIINAFIAPRKTFEDLERKASWWAPWALSAIFALLFGIVAVQKLDIPRLVQQGIEQNKMAQQRMEQAPPAQRESIIRTQVIVSKIVFFALPVISLVGGLLLAVIFWAVFNFAFAAEIGFQKAVAIVFYSFLPRIVPTILLSVSLLVSADPNAMDFVHENPLATNLAFFMDPESNKFLYVFASGLDIFAIWPAVLMGLGFSVSSARRRVSTGAGMVTVLVAYALWLLIRGGLRVAFS